MNKECIDDFENCNCENCLMNRRGVEDEEHSNC